MEGTLPSCIFMIRGHGDLKIEWDETNHANAVAMIQAKMDAGVSFFILDPSSKAKNPTTIVQIAKTDEATARKVFVKDRDIKSFIESGFGSIASFAGTIDMKEKVAIKAKVAEEAALTDTVAVQPSVAG